MKIQTLKSTPSVEMKPLEVNPKALLATLKRNDCKILLLLLLIQNSVMDTMSTSALSAQYACNDFLNAELKSLLEDLQSKQKDYDSKLNYYKEQLAHWEKVAKDDGPEGGGQYVQDKIEKYAKLINSFGSSKYQTDLNDTQNKVETGKQNLSVLWQTSILPLYQMIQTLLEMGGNFAAQIAESNKVKNI